VLAALAGWPLFVALVLVLGGVAARLFILRRLAALGHDLGDRGPGAADRAAEGTDPAAEGTVAPAFDVMAEAAVRLALAGALLMPLALGLLFLRQLLEFRDPFVPWSEDARLLLLGTAWGETWSWAMAASAACAGGFALAARARGVGTGSHVGWWVGAAAALALGFFPALTGHASGTGGIRWLTVTADGLHVYAAGAWLGGLTFVLYADRRVRRSVSGPRHALAAAPVAPEVTRAGRGATGAPPGSDAGALPMLVPLFSPLAVGCVATLVLTGVLAAWIHMPSPGAFVSAPYGRILGVKLLLAMLAFALGAANWRMLTPRLTRADGPAALRRIATLELWLGQAVLLATAALVRTAP